MEKINFIGAYDKTDSIMYIAKILTEMKKKVIIVDATITQKSKYVIPTVCPCHQQALCPETGDL